MGISVVGDSIGRKKSTINLAHQDRNNNAFRSELKEDIP